MNEYRKKKAARYRTRNYQLGKMNTHSATFPLQKTALRNHHDTNVIEFFIKRFAVALFQQIGNDPKALCCLDPMGCLQALFEEVKKMQKSSKRY